MMRYSENKIYFIANLKKSSKRFTFSITYKIEFYSHFLLEFDQNVSQETESGTKKKLI